MKKNHKTIQDSEDYEGEKSEDYSISSKRNKNQKNPENASVSVIPFEEQENIDFILMDFRQPKYLDKFKNMKSLTLIQQNINTLKVNKSV